MRELLRIYRRETGAYFVSPVAYLFIGVFLAVTLFVFFWVETFFARNIADVEPLFGWMPILLIALVAALTMRSWSEERRAGTLETLFTAPVPPLALVGGKFLAALSLVALALLLTVPLPLTVDYLGPLDWGPVIGGYVAALFLAAAYVAMGLFVSARTDNQVVSLIVTALIGGAFYLIGTDWLTALAPSSLAEAMRWLGTGSRFEDITRGVLDLRDIYYFVSLVALFLALNVYSLEKLRWGGEDAGARRHVAWRTAVALVAVNFLVANAWLQPISAARADITAENEYSLSPTTYTRLRSLREPLIIRAYISSKTHPLMKPLVPQLRNLLREYAIAGGDNVRLELNDPQANSAAAAVARKRYDIEPVPMRIASRYEASVVSTWFNVVLQYGNESSVLGFDDLVEVDRHGGTGVSATLHNPEYVLTRTIHRLVAQYRSEGDVLATLNKPITLHAYLSKPQQLPKPLQALRTDLHKMLAGMQTAAPDKLDVRFQDLKVGGPVAERLRGEYGIRPLRASLLSDQQFYFDILLEQDGRTVPVRLPPSLKADDLRDAITDGLRNFGGGYLNSVVVYRPHSHGGQRERQSPTLHYSDLMSTLRDNASVTRADLSDGRVPTRTDLLIVLAPSRLSDKQRFAIDQFLMRGGTVMIAASPKRVTISRRGGIQVQTVQTGLESWLARYGVDIGSSLVLDPQSSSLAMPTIGPGGQVRYRSVEYPYFVDVRGEGLTDLPMMGDLRQVTMAWSSPVSVDPKKAGDLEVTPLLQSSSRSWILDDDSVLPDYKRYPQSGFAPPDERGRQTLAVMLEGRFTSAFAEKGSPLVGTSQDNSSASDGSGTGQQAGSKGGGQEQAQPTITSVIGHSPAGSRLIVFGSPAFASDVALQIVRQTIGSDYGAPLQLVQNITDYSVGDPALLALRGGDYSSRLLRPVSDGTRVVLETANYGLAAVGLGLIFFVRRGVAERRRRWYESILNREDG